LLCYSKTQKEKQTASVILVGIGRFCTRFHFQGAKNARQPETRKMTAKLEKYGCNLNKAIAARIIYPDRVHCDRLQVSAAVD